MSNLPPVSLRMSKQEPPETAFNMT